MDLQPTLHREKKYFTSRFIQNYVSGLLKKVDCLFPSECRKTKLFLKLPLEKQKLNNQLQIEAGFKKDILAPLSIKKKSSVGNKTYQILRNLGVDKIKMIKEMPLEMRISIWVKNR